MTQSLLAKLSIGHEIGRGYFGCVYEGQDPVLGRVAVKTLERVPNEDATEWTVRKQNLLKEGRHLKEAEHDNIVRVFQVLESEDGNSVLLVMEYCDQGSLQTDYENGPMDLAAIRKVLSETALGLEVIHSRGKLHRDIKPANILRGANGRAKLADFGLVTDDIILGYASVAGYTDHLAPEVHRTGLTSEKTDVWAFGMTAYRLLHGKLFYEQMPRPSVLIPCGGFAQKLQWLPHVPDPWRKFIRRMLHDDPAARIQNASRILCGLEKLPIEPNWTCSFSPPIVEWSRNSKGRRIEVEWESHSPRKHTWQARAKFISGRERRLGGSNGIVTRNQAIAELQKFFRDPHLSNSS